jgi:CubicO group peptidase (beta-lactamase class C family)
MRTTNTASDLGSVGFGPTTVAEDLEAVTSTSSTAPAAGWVKPGFEPVQQAFIENFDKRRELGAACCVYHQGEKVVDLWGGIRNVKTGEPWEKDTMVVVYSTTKGLAAMTLALAHSRGWLKYDELVSTYWPGFAANGKEKITVRQLLAHQAGLFAFNGKVDRKVVENPERLARVMEQEKPQWEPGTRLAYHAITLGFYEGEIIRRIDPLHRTLGRFFQDEIASPLNIDFFIRLPEYIPNSRLAVMDPPGLLRRIWGFPLSFSLAAMYPRSNIYRALVTNPGSGIVHDDEHIYARNLEVPSGGGVGTARAIAKAYNSFMAEGGELAISRGTILELTAPAVPPQHGFHDECLKGEARFSLGFMKPCAAWPFDHQAAFGHPGAGGSIGYADPEDGISYAYVTNSMGLSLTGDPRDLALRKALDIALARLRES